MKNVGTQVHAVMISINDDRERLSSYISLFGGGGGGGGAGREKSRVTLCFSDRREVLRN